MQKRSHRLLASALLRSQQGFHAKRFELAFLFGSFQPDCNPLAYLRAPGGAKSFGGTIFPTPSSIFIPEFIASSGGLIGRCGSTIPWAS